MWLWVSVRRGIARRTRSSGAGVSVPSGCMPNITVPISHLAADQLTALRSDFPAFRIWQETTGDRNRYVARSLHPDTRPHTVVTADLDELRAILAAAPSPLAPPRTSKLGAASRQARDSR